MKYYTPKLFERTNSPDLDAALRASRTWEKQGKKYVESLDSWIETAPKGVRRLAEDFHGHDGLLIGQAFVGTNSFSLIVLGEFELWQLNYCVIREPRATPPVASPVFDKGDDIRLWLYDELSLVSAGHYRHDILFDNGSELQIDFEDVQLRESPRSGRYDYQIELPLTESAWSKAFPRSQIVPRASRTAPRQKTGDTGRRNVASQGKQTNTANR